MFRIEGTEELKEVVRTLIPNVKTQTLIGVIIRLQDQRAKATNGRNNPVIPYEDLGSIESEGNS